MDVSQETQEQVELRTGAYVGCSLEAMSGAVSFVARTWGDYGYRIERVAYAGSSGVLLGICHSDGSRFTVAADRYGNAREVFADELEAAAS